MVDSSQKGASIAENVIMSLKLTANDTSVEIWRNLEGLRAVATIPQIHG